MSPKKVNEITLHAVRTRQAGTDVYAFFLYGSEIARIADITRISRENGALKGFQRAEIRQHVRGIVEFLDSGEVLFPNAIILALQPGLKFTLARGSKPGQVDDVSQNGRLTIPVLEEGRRVAWVVDGQQRTLALAQASNSRIPVPVIAFVSSDLETQRAQFVLVNKARPLPQRLINELLPEVTTLLPRDLAAQVLPSKLVGLLNSHARSPFKGLIRRASSKRDEGGVVNDTALIAAIRGNLKPPMGALSQYERGEDDRDADGMFSELMTYWSRVRAAFPEAWGKPPTESRLMHSVGIRAMGNLMNAITYRADSTPNPVKEIEAALERLAPHCSWTEGRWEELGWAWNEPQSISRDVSRLTDFLIAKDRELSRRSAR